MQGQGNWYSGEIWINERSAELVREATGDRSASQRRRDGARLCADRRRDRKLARLLASVEQPSAARQAASLRQRLGGWMVRLVGGHP